VPGTRTFYDYELTSAVSMSLGSNGQLAEVTSHSHASESYRWVRHVTGVESGEISEAEVSFERWRRDKDEASDASLEGKTVTLVRDKGKLAAKLDDPDGVSGEARTWLDGELFRCGGRLGSTEFVEDLLLVREPAAVTTGCEWSRDPKALALGLLRTTDLDSERSSVKGKLEAVHVVRGVHYGRVEAQAVLQVRKLDMDELRFEDGGLVLVAWRYEGSLEPARREDAERSLTVTFEGHKKLPGDMDTRTRSERTETLKCGPAKK
jgi:hypothetical protein